MKLENVTLHNFSLSLSLSPTCFSLLVVNCLIHVELLSCFGSVLRLLACGSLLGN